MNVIFYKRLPWFVSEKVILNVGVQCRYSNKLLWFVSKRPDNDIFNRVIQCRYYFPNGCANFANFFSGIAHVISRSSALPMKFVGTLRIFCQDRVWLCNKSLKQTI